MESESNAQEIKASRVQADDELEIKARRARAAEFHREMMEAGCKMEIVGGTIVYTKEAPSADFCDDVDTIEEIGEECIIGELPPRASARQSTALLVLGFALGILVLLLEIATIIMLYLHLQNNGFYRASMRSCHDREAPCAVLLKGNSRLERTPFFNFSLDRADI